MKEGGCGGFLEKQKSIKYKKFVKIDMKTNEILETYSCIDDAVIKNEHRSRSGISDCCNGKAEFSKGFYWKFIDKNGKILESKEKREFKKYIRKVVKIKDNKIIKQYNSLVEAGTEEGKCPSTIYKYCINISKMPGGYEWKYIDDNKVITELQNKRNNIKKILQIDINSKKTINTFQTLKEASMFVGVCTDAISNSAKRKNGTSAGYMWKIIKY